MTAKTTVTSASSQQEEIDTLKAIVAKCAPGSYLSSFFTDSLVAWVTAQIHDDLPPDIWGALKYAEDWRDAEINRLSNASGNARDQLVSTENMLRELQEELKRTNALLVVSTNRNNEMAQRVVTLIATLKTTDTQVDQLVANIRTMAVTAWSEDRKIDPEDIRNYLNHWERTTGRADGGPLAQDNDSPIED